MLAAFALGCDSSVDDNLADAAVLDAPSVADASLPEPMVFLSSLQLSGDSIPGASARCSQLAEAVGLDGTWIAWISTLSEPTIESLEGTGPWYRPDGAMAFADRSALESGPEVPLELDEQGTVHADAVVYTGTGSDGQGTGDDCLQWASYYATEDATVGSSSSIDQGWTAAEVIPCDSPRHVYCFQSIAP